MVAAIAENPGKEVRKRLWRDPLKRVLFGKVVCLHVAGRPLDAQEASMEPILDTGTQAQPRESHSGQVGEAALCICTEDPKRFLKNY